jgi:acetyl-CoA synthetase
MEWERIHKRADGHAGANLQDYEGCARTFSWAQARTLLDGLPNGGLNIAHEAVDRHVLAGRGEKLALRWIGRDDRIRDFSYAALRAHTNRFASILAQHAIAKGDRVFSLLGRTPETLPWRSRHAQEWQRVLALVLGVRAGADQGPHDHRRCQGARHL